MKFGFLISLPLVIGFSLSSANAQASGDNSALVFNITEEMLSDPDFVRHLEQSGIELFETDKEITLPVNQTPYHPDDEMSYTQWFPQAVGGAAGAGYAVYECMNNGCSATQAVSSFIYGGVVGAVGGGSVQVAQRVFESGRRVTGVATGTAATGISTWFANNNPFSR